MIQLLSLLPLLVPQSESLYLLLRLRDRKAYTGIDRSSDVHVSKPNTLQQHIVTFERLWTISQLNVKDQYKVQKQKE